MKLVYGDLFIIQETTQKTSWVDSSRHTFQGNRARWIGGGCLMIALANFLISMSNFLFPVESIRLNGSVVGKCLDPILKITCFYSISQFGFLMIKTLFALYCGVQP